MRKIIEDWKLGIKFREITVFTQNYNEESIIKYGKQPTGDGNIEIYKTVCYLNYGKKEIYKVS